MAGGTFSVPALCRASRRVRAWSMISVGERMRLEKLGRGDVEDLGVLDGDELLALLVGLGLAGPQLLAQVLGQGRPAREEPVEVGLVLGVAAGLLEVLGFAIRAATSAALVAHLVDLTPAFGSLRTIIVWHRDAG